jgi:outer membrane protein assembly factor BamB
MLLYVNGIVYANSYSSTGPVASYAIALNANDGSLLWSVAGMKIASVVQTIAFATNQNGAEALNASNGSLLVQYPNASYLFSQNGIVYAVDSNNDLVAFRQSDGSLLWHYNFLGLGQACLPPMKGVLYCLSNDLKTEFALNATNGTFLWKDSLGSVGVFPPCPYAFNNVLYCIGNGNQTLFALNATSGTLLWKHGLLSIPGLLTSLNGITYVLTGIDTNNIFVVHVHAYNAMTGTLLWKY